MRNIRESKGVDHVVYVHQALCEFLKCFLFSRMFV